MSQEHFLRLTFQSHFEYKSVTESGSFDKVLEWNGLSLEEFSQYFGDHKLPIFP